MKSIESEELIVLIVLTGSNQVNKKFITCGLFRLISVVEILRNRGQNYLFI